MSELSTSRINRQLRSLRTKCASLNSLQTRARAPSKPAVSVTYGHSKHTIKRSQDEEEAPPLAILQSLDNLGARLHLDRAIVENMQLSKRIYEVRDAFRNIVQSAVGSIRSGSGMECPQLLPLTAICARLIGEHVQSEVKAALDEAEEGHHEDELGSHVLDEIYEEVPPSHRYHTLVAHALTYILDECPHDPTLLNSLLEVCLSHGLVTEARTALSALFNVAVQPRPHSTYICPLNHPAHKDFLRILRETCSASIVNDRSFTGTLVNTLCEPFSTRLQAWTSKAVTKLARDLRERDFGGSFVPLCCGLMATIAEERRKLKTSCRAGKDSDKDHAKLYRDSCERLAKWVISMLDRLYTSSHVTLDDLRCCVDFLADAALFHLHVSDEITSSPQTCLADALSCLTAYCLSSEQATSLHPSELSALRGLLQSAHIKNSTFNGLVSYIFPIPRFVMFAMPLAEPEGADTPTPPPTPSSANRDCLDKLSSLAAPLRGHGLLKCEAALWLAALQHIEELIAVPTVTQSMTTPGRKLNQSELYNLRLALMDRMEEAERRCYGGGSDERMADIAPPSIEGEWEWEEMIGSWVLKSPAPARAQKERYGDQAKQHPSPLPRPNLIPAQRPPRFETILADARTNTISLRAEREAAAKARAKAAKRDSLFSPHAIPVSAPPRLTHTPHRQTNFATILADGQRNVISLREERARNEQLRYKRRSSDDTTSDLEEQVAPLQARKKLRQTYAPEPESSPMRDTGLGHPSSDDALNLFAYPDSSPGRNH
ncbi:hypothetical protein BN946_scf184994.g58 [Trametes cinnabarina]|uniref:Uncharacterized protein n=1 Tax=Pycnoporus cinnabarinus TaxID=5643 RepID=A0A060SEP7_PYCCI|nr:hypothetical protein BN946_scf184994.g58 [Trametes cinnabarina]